MTNLIGASVIVNDCKTNEAFSAMVIDQNDVCGTVTVLDQNDDCFEVSIDQVTLDVDAA